ncbi:MAG: hypothetical protein WA655_25235 [Candidatus Korobacteraceae bacterium]
MALYQGTASQAAEKVAKADASALKPPRDGKTKGLYAALKRRTTRAVTEPGMIYEQILGYWFTGILIIFFWMA